MQMPVAVGVLVSIIFLITFSEWFYHTFISWKEVIIDDRLFKFRIFGATTLSLFVISLSFLGAAYISKCPQTEREGIFERLNCEEYQKIKIKAGF